MNKEPKLLRRFIYSLAFVCVYFLSAIVLTFIGVFIGGIIVGIQKLDGPVLIVYNVSFLVGLILAVPTTLYMAKRFRK